jgi:FtsH-binding integral membrane protein
MNKTIYVVGMIGAFLVVNGLFLDFLSVVYKPLTSFEIMILVGLNLVCLSFFIWFYKEELSEE